MKYKDEIRGDVPSMAASHLISNSFLFREIIAVVYFPKNTIFMHLKKIVFDTLLLNLTTISNKISTT